MKRVETKNLKPGSIVADGGGKHNKKVVKEVVEYQKGAFAVRLAESKTHFGKSVYCSPNRKWSVFAEGPFAINTSSFKNMGFFPRK